MDSDKLQTPLRRQSLRDRLSSISITPLAVCVFATCAGAIGFAVWLYSTADPLGGEPVAIIAVAPGDISDNVPGSSSAAGAPKGKIRVIGGGETVELDDGVEKVVNPPTMNIENVSDAAAKMRSSGRLISIPSTGNEDLAALDEQYGETEGFVPSGMETGDNLATGSITAATSIIKLAGAPARGLFEKSQYGLLPKISGGRIAAKIYARPVDPGRVRQLRGRIAIIIGGMGLSSRMTQKAINDLPAEISLAFAPYGSGLPGWAKRARGQGHEIMLQIPMEPYNYPKSNPGPRSLLTSNSTEENLERLRAFMGLITGYTGVVNYMGAKFSTHTPSLGPILAEFKRRGVYYLDDGSTGRTKALEIGEQFGLGVRRADVVIDEIAGAQNTRIALKRLEALATQRGWAIGVGTALPTTLNEITKWEETLEKSQLGLVPVTSLY
jgi:polysaccharide deacetylase 2 family uncharacterized protein YibQ